MSSLSEKFKKRISSLPTKALDGMKSLGDSVKAKLTTKRAEASTVATGDNATHGGAAPGGAADSVVEESTLNIATGIDGSAYLIMAIIGGTSTAIGLK